MQPAARSSLRSHTASQHLLLYRNLPSHLVGVAARAGSAGQHTSPAQPPPGPYQRVPPSSPTVRMASLNGGGIKTRSGSGTKRPGQELNRSGASGSGPEPIEEEVITPVPLKYVVQEAVKRWFEDTVQEAARGDIKQQALLGQMYAEGYGVAKDAKAAKEWTDKASARGYRMQGVYCEL